VDPPGAGGDRAEYGIWFHVDGAYGAPAAVLPDAPADLKALALADSVAVDPHKWLYAPLEAGCVLVRDPAHLRDAFSYTPSYYKFDTEGEEPPSNYYELGPQNSRGFRALKVWLGLRQAGREGYARMIADDCRLRANLPGCRRASRDRGDQPGSASPLFRYASRRPVTRGSGDGVDPHQRGAGRGSRPRICSHQRACRSATCCGPAS
jgi:glutamate/tyrosine decarboxylase-like PLP-dependent enzyme